MQINLTDILTCDHKVLEMSCPIEMDTFVSAMGSFPVKKKSLCDLRITNLGESRLHVEGTAELTVVIPCDRCLGDVDTELHLAIDKEMKMRPESESRKGTAGDRTFREDTLDEIFEEETEFIFGYNLDVDELVYSEILVNWPMKTLCKESCKGVCRKCGTNLNHGSCNCDTVELDPRMAAIRDIFKTVNEEV